MDFVLRALAGTDGASLYWAGGTVWTLDLNEAVRFRSDKAAKATAVLLSALGVIRGGTYDAKCVEFGPTVLVETHISRCDCANAQPVALDRNGRFVCSVCRKAP